MAKRVLYLTGTYPKASETFIKQEMELLQACREPSFFPAAVFRGEGEDSMEGMTYLCEESAGSAVSNHAGLSKLKMLLGGHLRGMAAIHKHKDKLERLSYLVNQNDVDHIHAAFGGLPALLCSTVAKAHDVSYSVSVHANDILCSPYDDRSMLGQAKRIFCCNHRVMKELNSRSPWTYEKTHYIPHGLCLKEWPGKPENYDLHTPLKFLFVGRLTEKKDPFRAMELVDALNKEGISANITFLGDGPLKDGAMDVTGFKSRSEVREYMVASDFILCTSRELPDGDMEGIPNVILEAMATGLPVIAPLTGGIGEVLSEETGFPCDVGDTRGFVTLIKTIMERPEHRIRCCERARELVCKNFDAEEVIDQKRQYFAGI